MVEMKYFILYIKYFNTFEIFYKYFRTTFELLLNYF